MPVKVMLQRVCWRVAERLLLMCSGRAIVHLAEGLHRNDWGISLSQCSDPGLFFVTLPGLVAMDSDQEIGIACWCASVESGCEPYRVSGFVLPVLHAFNPYRVGEGVCCWLLAPVLCFKQFAAPSSYRFFLKTFLSRHKAAQSVSDFVPPW